MRPDKEPRFSLRDTRMLLPVFVCVVMNVCFCAAQADRNANGAKDIDFAAFHQALDASDDAKAASIGDLILGCLEQKYRGNAGFETYKSKLNAAEFLANKMSSQLQNAARRGGKSLGDELFAEKGAGDKDWLGSIAPARKLYETSVKLFSAPISISELQEQEKAFLSKYYDLKLRTLTSALAKAGQALVIAEPAFGGTHDYVLVLPLLHASDQRPINIDVLPRWMQKPEHLTMLSDSCLLHFGFPFHAMTLARKAAQAQDKPFSEVDFYRSAAKGCGKSNAHTAAESLRNAVDCVPDDDPNTRADLQFEIVQLWLDSENYSLAAGEARKIFETYPDIDNAGKAVWLYHYALSRANKIDEIMLHIDEALADGRCKPYKPRLMYIKWWALCRQRDNTAALAALEYELITQYGNNPMIAPILLSQATDLLARQDYNGAYESLAQLVQKFPSTKAAEQAKKMLDKLKPGSDSR